MPRLRKLPDDFLARRRGFRSPQASLEEGRRTGGLLADYALACRAGRAVMPLVRTLGLPLDYSDGRGVRVEEGRIVLVTDNASQLSRLRNLQPRILERLVAEGVPVTGVDFRVRAHAADPAPVPPPAIAVRTPSLVASAELESTASRILDPGLREQLRALARTLAPTEGELPLALMNVLSGEKERLPALQSRLEELAARVPDAPDPTLIPSEEAVLGDERLAGVRERMLERLARRDRMHGIIREARRFFSETDLRLDRLLECTMSDDIPLPDWLDDYFRACAPKTLLGTLPAGSSGAEKLSPERLARLDALSRAAVTISRRLVRARRRLDEEIAGLDATAPAATLAPVSTSVPSEDAPSSKAGLVPGDLRGMLRTRGERLAGIARSTRKLIGRALDRLPPAGSLESADERLARDLERVAQARSRGEAHPEDRLSAESARRLLLWSTRERLEERLRTIDRSLETLLGRLAADRSFFRTSHLKSASALAADFTALKEIDRRRAGDREELSRLSTEAETLSESVEVLLAELPDRAFDGEQPVAVALEAACSLLGARLEAIGSRLGIRPNLQLVLSESEAAGTRKFSELRSRQIERLNTYAEHEALVRSARETLSALRRVLHAPRPEPLDAPLIEALVRSLGEVLSRTEAARKVISPDLPPLPDTETLLAVTPGSRPVAPHAGRERPEPAGTTKEGATSGDETAPSCDDEAAVMLAGFAGMTELWKSRRPGMPDERLIPSEEDAAKDPRLDAVRTRMLARRDRRQEIDAALAEFLSLLESTKALLHGPQAARGALPENLARLEADAGRIGALVESPLPLRQRS